jgi:hypothetical protein
MPERKMNLRSRLTKLEGTRPEPEPQPSIDIARLSDATLAEIAALDAGRINGQTELDVSKLSNTALKELLDAYD